MYATQNGIHLCSTQSKYTQVYMLFQEHMRKETRFDVNDVEIEKKKNVLLRVFSSLIL
jgi:hypothetical protein